MRYCVKVTMWPSIDRTLELAITDFYVSVKFVLPSVVIFELIGTILYYDISLYILIEIFYKK